MAIISTRGGSKGAPRKNIRSLTNKPLNAHTRRMRYRQNVLSVSLCLKFL